jgi:hypothetical protein
MKSSGAGVALIDVLNPRDQISLNKHNGMHSAVEEGLHAGQQLHGHYPSCGVYL